jgi:hypothetical protein
VSIDLSKRGKKQNKMAASNPNLIITLMVVTNRLLELGASDLLLIQIVNTAAHFT